jgi:DNA-directed RNA polymerase III subunit RPC1
VLDTRQKKITAISFGVFSDQQVKQLSVVEMHERNIYDVSGPTRVPAKFGVLDNRLGPTVKGANCDTCDEPHQSCVGHFGI